MQTDTPSPAAEGRGGKLTERQRSLLLRSVLASEAGTILRPQDITTAGELSALDLVKHHRSTDGIWMLAATTAGREALSREKTDD